MKFFHAVLLLQVMLVATLPTQVLGIGWASLILIWLAIPVFGVIVWRFFRCSVNVKIAIFAAMGLALATLWNNDLALVSAWMYDGGATLPYGRLWFWLDPFWSQPGFVVPQWGPPWQFQFHEYLWYLFGVQMLALGAMLRAKRIFSKRYVFWTQVFNAMLVVIHNPQSIVAMQFVYLAPLSLTALGVAAAIKFPLGWSGGWANPHVQCFTGAIQLDWGPFHVTCGRLLWQLAATNDNFTTGYDYANYAAIIIVVALMLNYWFHLWPRQLKVPLPGRRALAVTMNKGKLVLGFALWKGQDRPRHGLPPNRIDSVAVLDEIRNEDDHGRE